MTIKQSIQPLNEIMKYLYSSNLTDNRADPKQPPRQASPATPPQEGNKLVQTLNDHLVRLRLPPLHRRGMTLKLKNEWSS